MRAFLLPIGPLRGCGRSLAQSAQPQQPPAKTEPPVKMGLWEIKTLIKAGDKEPTNQTVRSCISRESWPRMFGNAQTTAACHLTTTQSGNMYTTDGECPHGDTSVKTHNVLLVLDTEHFTLSREAQTVVEGEQRTVYMQSAAQLVSTDCGTMKPGEMQ